MSTSFSSFKSLFFYMRSHRVTLLCATLCTVLYNVCDIFPEVFIGVIIDVLINKQNSFLAYFGIIDVASQLYILAASAFVVWLFDALFEYLSDVTWRRLAQTVQHELRVDAYGHMQELEMAYFEDKSTGELLTILNDDINQLEHFFDKGISDFIYFVVSVVLVGIIFFYLSPTIAIFAFFPVPLILFIAHKFQSRLGMLYTSVREHAGLLGARIANNILGISMIKSYATEHYELKRLSDESQAYKKSNDLSINLSSAFIPMVRVTIACGFVVTVVLGGLYALQGTLAIGSYSILVSMTQRLLWPFIYFAKASDVYKRAMACARRVFAIIETPIGIKDGLSSTSVMRVQGKIEFKDISFAYSQGIKIFDNLSISVEPGQTVGVVGSTGSGKTTLIKLLLRFYDPHQGSILLDGFYTKDLKLKLLRQAFGLVSQDVFLFKGTIRENIAYGAPCLSHEEIEYAARLAEIHDFIMSLPHGYDTMIGEQGQRLSGGQRQRISIARAVVNKPPIFIFDEATSSVDNETEAAIQRSLDTISKDHTIVVIAHRLSTVRHADNIFVLDKGAVVEKGAHDDLIDYNGIYAKLWRVQMGEKH